MVELTFGGLVPSKKNNRNIFTRDDVTHNLPSQDYNDWHEAVAMDIKLQLRGYGLPIKQAPLYAGFIFIMPDKRRRDLSNMMQSIEDLLKDLGAITDDAWTFWQIAGAQAILRPGESGALVAIEDDLTVVRKWLDINISKLVP